MPDQSNPPQSQNNPEPNPNQAATNLNPQANSPAAAVMEDPIKASTADPTTSKSSGNYAGFWIRLVAAFIDGVILSIVNNVIGAIFGGALGFASLGAQPEESLATAGLFAGLLGFALLISILINVGYYVILTGVYGATLGKMVFGLRVVDASGQKIGIGKAALREIIGKFVSGVVFGLGYLWVAFDENKQGWHDKIAGTFVVKTR